ncbi:E3 UFM1-protein ligase 1 homolog isoform X2 [Carya illinoinensis]|uniref:E3 UFM1-protein ligase 1 homolog isoform X2 n=1 Tax=Carya illinoinensis TaxID=32201 RepID=UPI001C71A638|nr:E3 UFM1-protein ligase 1 homolog isoform X2 [Carya illinoinensis]
MDEELLELQRQFEFAQQVKSSIRLSDRNVVELVQKLQELRIIDFELLHTVSGKEYITPEQLRHEIVAEIKKLGRVSLIDIADTTGVDLYHVEKQAQCVVSNDLSLMLIQGEIISQSYWDSVAEEINERLQECSQIALAELAAQLQVGSELITSVLEPRLGTVVKGRLEGGQLYTPAYVARVSAMVRGSARGITVPTNLSVSWSSLQKLLYEMDGASGVAIDISFFQSLFNGLVKEGEVLGSLRAGVHWIPNVFAIAQKECVDSFFSQNSFISYEALRKLGIPQPVPFLQSRYPEGMPLVTAFVHPSLIEMLDAATEDALERNSWIDSLSVLPASFEAQDAYKILSLCPSVQLALKSNRALIFGESYIFSNGFIKSFLNMQLYEKALDLFEDDQSTSVVLHRHLLRTTAAPIVDTLLHDLDIHNKLRNGVEVEEARNSESGSVSPGERIALAKRFPGSLSNMAFAVVEALEGKRVETFMDAFRALAEESGLVLKKLDKKLERTLLHSYRKDLTSQVSAETDPVSLLPKVISLLYLQIHHKALQAPGRAISVAVSRLKEKVDASAYKILTGYQTATVTLLALISAATGNEEDDCSSDRILTQRELLENQMPALKGLVLSS